jgi:hypothetical protein
MELNIHYYTYIYEAAKQGLSIVFPKILGLKIFSSIKNYAFSWQAAEVLSRMQVSALQSLVQTLTGSDTNISRIP